MCVAVSILHTNVWAVAPSHSIAAHTHAIARASTGAPVAVANALHAEEGALNGTEARPGTLRTSSTAIPCDLEQKKWTWRETGSGLGKA